MPKYWVKTWDEEVDALAWMHMLDLSDDCLPPGERVRAREDRVEPSRFVEYWYKKTYQNT